MSGLRRTVLVTVIVASGAVAFDLGGSTGLLSAGMSRAFAEDAKPAALPEGIRGFQGMVRGTVVSKGELGFVLKVARITKVWKGNKAGNPECIVGREVPVRLWPKGRMFERQLKVLAGLKPGDVVSVEPFHRGGDHLTVVEGLKKVEEEPDKPDDGGSTLPEGIRGFQGMMTGTIVKKGTDEFLLKVETIDRTWRGNKAKNPESVVGKTLPVALWKESRLYERHRETLATLKPGDRVSVEPFHRGGNHLSVVEALKKID